MDPATGYRRYTTGQIPAAQVIDRSYGALAAHVAEHALQVDGPIR